MMKERLLSAFSTVVCVALVVAALCIGVVGGWSDEREHVALSDEAVRALRVRAMDGVNLAVVAARHVGEGDASVKALRSAFVTLKQDAEDAKQLAQVDETITQAVSDLASRLPEMASVRESERDSAYVAALTRTLMDTSGTDSALSAAQAAFDKRIQASLTGRLAMLLGVKPFGTMEQVEVAVP